MNKITSLILLLCLNTLVFGYLYQQYQLAQSIADHLNVIDTQQTQIKKHLFEIDNIKNEYFK